MGQPQPYKGNHCLQPAPWLLRVVPNKGDRSRSINAWATCDEHIAEAASNLIAQMGPAMSGAHLELRAEPEPV